MYSSALREGRREEGREEGRDLRNNCGKFEARQTTPSARLLRQISRATALHPRQVPARPSLRRQTPLTARATPGEFGFGDVSYFFLSRTGECRRQPRWDLRRGGGHWGGMARRVDYGGPGRDTGLEAGPMATPGCSEKGSEWLKPTTSSQPVLTSAPVSWLDDEDCCVLGRVDIGSIVAVQTGSQRGFQAVGTSTH